MSVTVAAASHEKEREAPHYLRGNMMKQVKEGKEVRMMRVHTDKTQKCMLHTSA